MEGSLMYRVLIAEDTPADAEILRTYVERYAVEHDIELEVAWTKTAFDLVEDATHADLLFLDIEMPGITGMEGAALLRTVNQAIPIVFVTNLAQLAIRGYEVEALDFMVKPVSYEAFSLRMAKALRTLAANRDRTISLPVGGSTEVVFVDDIYYVEAYGHDVVFHLARGRELRMRNTLSAVESQLPANQFVRISRSVIVNIAQVSRYHGPELMLFDGTELTFGRRMRKAALEKITDYLGGKR